jgi:hypothetical protein
MDKDTKKLLREIEAQGFTVKYSGKGYPMVYAADGRFVTKLAQTPSDRRGWMNGIAALRRAGLQWPPKK